MSGASVPVDLRNPGQVFACLGIAEAAEVVLEQPVQTVFRGERGAQRVQFEIQSTGDANPVREVVSFLRCANVSVVVPSAAMPDAGALIKKRWDIDEATAPERGFPSPIPRTLATVPARLSANGHSITLSSWADGPQDGLDNVKFWAGAAGYPGAALARDTLKLISQLPVGEIDRHVADPFAISAPMSSSFRFDWRRDYIPLDAGFSPNEHGDVTMVGYPFTEILATVGLQYARPARVERNDKLRYRYGVWYEPLPTIAARVVLGAVYLGISQRTFSMTLGWPGQEGQARCIIDAVEVNQLENAN